MPPRFYVCVRGPRHISTRFSTLNMISALRFIKINELGLLSCTAFCFLFLVNQRVNKIVCQLCHCSYCKSGEQTTNEKCRWMWKKNCDISWRVRGLPGRALRSSLGYSGQGTHMSEALSKLWLLWPSCYFCFFPVHALSFLSHTRALEGWPRILKACHTTGYEHLCTEKVTKLTPLRKKNCFSIH